MSRNLTFAELARLFHSVFAFRPQEKAFTFFVDLPSEKVNDNALWKDRRRIETEWFLQLQSGIDRLPFTALNYCAYENVGSNNGDLPHSMLLLEHISASGETKSDVERPLREILEESSIVVAMTELSATAPLKNLAREMSFRGATLPGFTRGMIPALGLDYEKVNARVMEFKDRLDRANEANITFSTNAGDWELTLDLRFTTAHASGGIIRETGTVANLPSGEAYIVPFEGNEREKSRTQGDLPVQFGNEIVVFHVLGNRVVEVSGEGRYAREQEVLLEQEPAYGNLAELGLGVLGEWGILPVGSTLLDEKLGPHIAFGRSDHFGGRVGPKSFSDPARVVHIDWVFTPELQPMVKVRSMWLTYPSGVRELILVDGKMIV
jgi:hypothetical protein